MAASHSPVFVIGTTYWVQKLNGRFSFLCVTLDQFGVDAVIAITLRRSMRNTNSWSTKDIPGRTTEKGNKWRWCFFNKHFNVAMPIELDIKIKTMMRRTSIIFVPTINHDSFSHLSSTLDSIYESEVAELVTLDHSTARLSGQLSCRGQSCITLLVKS